MRSKAWLAAPGLLAHAEVTKNIIFLLCCPRAGFVVNPLDEMGSGSPDMISVVQLAKTDVTAALARLHNLHNTKMNVTQLELSRCVQCCCDLIVPPGT